MQRSFWQAIFSAHFWACFDPVDLQFSVLPDGGLQFVWQIWHLLKKKSQENLNTPLRLEQILKQSRNLHRGASIELRVAFVETGTF